MQIVWVLGNFSSERLSALISGTGASSTRYSLNWLPHSLLTLFHSPHFLECCSIQWYPVDTIHPGLCAACLQIAVVFILNVHKLTLFPHSRFGIPSGQTRRFWLCPPFEAFDSKTSTRKLKKSKVLKFDFSGLPLWLLTQHLASISQATLINSTAFTNLMLILMMMTLMNYVSLSIDNILVNMNFSNQKSTTNPIIFFRPIIEPLDITREMGVDFVHQVSTISQRYF